MEMNSNKRMHSHFQPSGPSHAGQQHGCEERERRLSQADSKRSKEQRLPSILLDTNLLSHRPRSWL